jgi:hypothetical protein
MPKAVKTPQEKAYFAARVDSLRQFLPSSPGVRVNTLHPHIPSEHVIDVLRKPVRRYNDEILAALEALAMPTVAVTPKKKRKETLA